LFFADDKAILWDWQPRIEQRLAQLRVIIHPGAHPRPVSEGVPFLGFIVYPQQRRLKRRKGIYFQRKLRDLIAAYQNEQLPLDKITASVRGWINHVRYGNTAGLRKAMLGRPFSSHPK
jgi:hypothetical protein